MLVTAVTETHIRRHEDVYFVDCAARPNARGGHNPAPRRRAGRPSFRFAGCADLQTSDTLYLNADESFHAASTMKVPVMIELYRRIDAGALALDQGILLVNQFGSIVDGSAYSLDAGDDSDSSAYRLVGSRVPVRELIDRMITRSSNLATNALIELVGATNANATAHMLGARDIRVLRGVEDDKAFRAGLNNTTTAI